MNSAQSDSSKKVSNLEPSKGNDLKIKSKILVVDDEPDARELFVELISTNEDYEVMGATDGVDALKQASENKFDLILLDIIMPKMDGVDTLSALKKDKVKYGDPLVIMLTNIGGDVAVEKALELGAIGFKLKIDTEPEELLRTINDALINKTIISSTPRSLF